MSDQDELEELRAEQQRLQTQLNFLDERIRRFEVREPIPEQVSPPPPAIPPLPVPDFAFEPPRENPAAPSPEIPLPLIEAPQKELPPPIPQPGAAPRESFEMRLGRVWLARIGIVILLTGLVFLGNYAYHELIGRIGAVGKLALLYLAGAGLCTLGGWFARRQASLLNYGRVLIAGGCATIYYATYAAHFIPSLRVIESPLLGGALLLALGGAFVAWADRLRSQTLAAATIALAFYTSSINPVATFSLFSNLVIAVAAITLLARRRWVSVSFLSLLGTYGSFAFWRIQQSHTLMPTAIDASIFWAAVLFPAGYWIVHTAAVLLRRVNALDPAVRPAFLTVNNAAFFALFGPAIAGTYPHSFWLAAVLFGAVLLVLSAIAARTAPEETLFDGSYLSQGFALIFVGLLYKFTGWQLALSFSLLSGTLVSLGRLRHGGVYRFFAGVCAIVAACVAFKNIVEGETHARLVAYAVVGFLTATAWLLKRNLALPQKADWRAFGFTLLAGLLVMPAALDTNSLPWSGATILGIALLAMLTLRFHRLPELAYIAQPLALGGQVILLAHALFESKPDAPTIISTAFALSIIHFWQWQKCHPLAGRRTWQAIHCIVPIVLTLTWSFQRLPLLERSPSLALLAILLLAYALLTRTWIIVAASIPFTLTAYTVASGIVLEQTPGWLSPFVTIALLVAQSFALATLEKYAPLPPRILPHAARVIRGFALLLGVGMLFAYLPGHAWFLALIASAFVFFLLNYTTKSAESIFYAFVLGAIATASWVARLTIAPAYWPDLFGFAIAIAVQQIGKRRLNDTGWFGPQTRALFSTLIVFGVWILIHRLVGSVAGGFLITVSWSLLALVVLAGGFALKDRAYRLLGLAILAAAVGRIFFVDVWQLETLYRILSFLVLGTVLLTLAFLYNRFAETLRRWL